MNSKKYTLYDRLGFLAVLFTLIASLLSFIVYLIFHKTEYLFYALMWFIIALIDYILWSKRPGR
ncbi:MAG: hypothetical protein B6U89_04920 [Desulfurococcales archaeon ex4484_58]|nr:MAG: hypothetical protein B6U89_04920 [Desulfurococcales archaeon ex4484_58]